MERELSSRANPFLRHVKRLGTDAAYRRTEGLYLCDGLTLLREALQSSVSPADIVAADSLALPPLPDKLRVTRVPPALLDSLSPVEHPQGVLTICPLPPALCAPPPKGRYLFLERLQDPGNVGSLLRCADAFGLDGAYLSADCADAFHPKTVRAAMGALFRLPLGQTEAESLIGGTVPFFASAPRGDALTAGQAVYPKDWILALGNEGQGLQAGTLRRAAHCVRIPMRDGAESLGVAAAGAVLIWDMTSK